MGPKEGLAALLTCFAGQDHPAKVPIRPENHYRAQLVFLPAPGRPGSGGVPVGRALWAGKALGQ